MVVRAVAREIAKLCNPGPENERLRRNAVVIPTVGALAVGTAFWLGPRVGDALGHTRPGTSVRDVVTANRLKLDARTLDCNAQTLWDVAGSEQTAQLTIGGRQVPQVGQTTRFEDPSRVGVLTCAENSERYIKSIEIKDGEVNQGLNYHTITVKVPVDKIKTEALFPEGNKKIVSQGFVLSKAVNAGADALSAAATLACAAKNPADVFFNTGQCAKQGDSINNFAKSIEAKHTASAESAVLRAVRKDGSKVDWANTKNAIIDSYKGQAVAQVGKPEAADLVTVEFVDEHGNPTDAIPAFNESIFDKYKGKELNAETDNADVHTKITIKPPEPYQPKYFDPATGKSRSAIGGTQ